MLELQADAGGAMQGRTIAEARLRRLRNLCLAEIDRHGAIIPAPGLHTTLQAGDRLIFVGLPNGACELRGLQGLSYAQTPLLPVDPDSGRHFVEVVLSRLAPVIGRSVRDSQFRERYGAVVLAINRHGRELREKLGEVVLQSGDTLLLETKPDFVLRHDQSHDFAMLNRVGEDNGIDPRRAFMALAFVVATIAANVLLRADVLTSALAATLGMLATGCPSFPLRLARPGGAADCHDRVRLRDRSGIQRHRGGCCHGAPVVGRRPIEPLDCLVAVNGATVVFTELVTNSASAVLMFPVGLATAAQLGVHPMPFVKTVMFAASASFITPIGYQTNLMVYGRVGTASSTTCAWARHWPSSSGVGDHAGAAHLAILMGQKRQNVAQEVSTSHYNHVIC
ncbi:hypothetical protein LQ772_13460 [Frateuria edaphi]|uniref:TrkA C-terminal domain-containing protein n=1 Tax=Frateuria edaphi TaxID=2898793 RepID=UPI001E5B562C|nr:TrkA C-terminal domain-containing protein [Frateuria edaphi]UGB44988.1 hypothetical protein LQ772_13460 [Frateuria edaphi]